MRRIVLTLVGLGMFLCGTNVAMAHGYGHHGHGASYGHHASYRGAYYGGYGGFGVGYAPAPIYGSYGCRTGYGGYGYGGYGGYGYAYPPAGIGVAGRNFSLWFGQ